MTRPGAWLRSLAAVVCHPLTMERLIDPAVADMRTEYAEAIRRDDVWRGRWVLMCGYVACLKVFAQCATFEIRQATREWNADDRGALGRTLWIAGFAMVLGTVLLELLVGPFNARGTHPRAMALVVFLVPSLLALSVPTGLAIGTAIGLADRYVSRRAVMAILAIAVASSVAEFVNLGWITPAANQAYREEIVGGSVRRGTRELSFGELKRSVNAQTLPSPIGERAFEYHKRLALAATPLTLAGFALVIVMRRRLTRTAAAMAACAAAGGYLPVLWLGQFFMKFGFMTPSLAAWFPQIALIVAMTAMLPTSPAARCAEGAT